MNQLPTTVLAAKTTSSEARSYSSNLSPRLLAEEGLTGSKTHHRNTSIVHGIQHSRNGSYASSSTSPLSPQMIATAGGERPDVSNMADFSFSSTISSTSGASFASSTTLVPDRASTATDNTNHTLTQRRVERMHSGRSRRDHGRSHSRQHHHKDELKTVGEYALHVLFTSVSVQGHPFTDG